MAELQHEEKSMLEQAGPLNCHKQDDKCLDCHTKCLLLSDIITTTMDVLCEELLLCGEIERVDGATGFVKRQKLVEFLINFYRTYNEKLEELSSKLKELDAAATGLNITVDQQACGLREDPQAIGLSEDTEETGLNVDHEATSLNEDPEATGLNEDPESPGLNEDNQATGLNDNPQGFPKVESASYKADEASVQTDKVIEIKPKKCLRTKITKKQPPDKAKDTDNVKDTSKVKSCKVKDTDEEVVITKTEKLKKSQKGTNEDPDVKEEDSIDGTSVQLPKPLECESLGNTQENKSESGNSPVDGGSDTDCYDYDHDGDDSECNDEWLPEVKPQSKKKRRIKNSQPVQKKRAKPLPKIKNKRENVKSRSLQSNNKLKKTTLKNTAKRKIKKETKAKTEMKVKKETKFKSEETLNKEVSDSVELESMEENETNKNETDDKENKSESNVKSKVIKKRTKNRNESANSKIMWSLNSSSSEIQEDDAENYEKLPMTLKMHQVRDIDIYFKVRGSDPVVLMCRVCAYKIQGEELMTEHIHTHTGERPYTCPICNRSYIRKKHLRRHELAHTGVKPNRRKNYQCDICSGAFDCKSKLNEHRAGHTGEKPHSCKLCDFATRFSKNLRNHMDVMHPSEPRERKYTCSACNRAYLSHNTLRAHIKDCHDTECHICEICGKNFGSWSGLREHYLSHKDRVYQCPYCEFRTNRPKTLKVHKTKHFDRRIQCDMCGKILRSIASLKNHLKVMHGPNSAEGKIFSCLFCGASYDGRRKMSAHMRKHKRKLSQQGSKDAEFAMTHFVALPKNSSLEHSLGKKPTSARRNKLSAKHKQSTISALTATPPSVTTSESDAATTTLEQTAAVLGSHVIDASGQGYSLQQIGVVDHLHMVQDYSDPAGNSAIMPRLEVATLVTGQESGLSSRQDSNSGFQDLGTSLQHHNAAVLNPNVVSSIGNQHTLDSAINVSSSSAINGPSDYSQAESRADPTRLYHSPDLAALNRSVSNGFNTTVRQDIHNSQSTSTSIHGQDSNLSRPSSAYNTPSEVINSHASSAAIAIHTQSDVNSVAPTQTHTRTNNEVHLQQQRHIVNIQPRMDLSHTSADNATYHRTEAIMNRAVTSMVNRPEMSYNRPIMMSHDHTGHPSLETLEAVNSMIVQGFPSPSPYMSPWVPSGYPNFHPP